MNPSRRNHEFNKKFWKPSYEYGVFSRFKINNWKRGQELVEFAIILWVLILVLFGVLDLGRVFFSAITITNAAREGARYGTFHPDDPSGIITAAIAETPPSSLIFDRTLLTVTPNCPCYSGNPVVVTVTYPFDLILGNIIPFSTITMTRRAEMLVP